MTQQIELDEGTKARLAAEVERLVSMEIDRKQARRIVWEDYQAELATDTAVVQPTATDQEPQPEQLKPSGARFWNAKDEPVLTKDWLESNRKQLSQVKRIIGMRSR